MWYIFCFDIKLRKNLKEEFAFWDKNLNRSTQPDTLKKYFLIALEGIPISCIEPERVFSQVQLQL
jgi:hypothetical protein